MKENKKKNNLQRPFEPGDLIEVKYSEEVKKGTQALADGEVLLVVKCFSNAEHSFGNIPISWWCFKVIRGSKVETIIRWDNWIENNIRRVRHASTSY